MGFVIGGYMSFGLCYFAGLSFGDWRFHVIFWPVIILAGVRPLIEDFGNANRFSIVKQLE